MLPKKRSCCDFVDGNVLMMPPSQRPRYSDYKNNTVRYCDECDKELYETKVWAQDVKSPFQCFFCLFWHKCPQAYSNIHLRSNSLLLIYGNDVVHSSVATQTEPKYSSLVALDNVDETFARTCHDKHRLIREYYQEMANNRVEMNYACLDLARCKKHQALTTACLQKAVMILAQINLFIS